MDEMIKNDLLKKLYLFEKEDKHQDRIKQSSDFDSQLFSVYKETIVYFVNNKLQDRNDIIELRDLTKYILRNLRIRYDGERKVERMKVMIDRIGKK